MCDARSDTRGEREGTAGSNKKALFQQRTKRTTRMHSPKRKSQNGRPSRCELGSECVINSARVQHRPLVILMGGGSNVWKVVLPSSNYVAESSTLCCLHDCVCVFQFRPLEWLLAILLLSTFSWQICSTTAVKSSAHHRLRYIQKSVWIQMKSKCLNDTVKNVLAHFIISPRDQLYEAKWDL